MSKNRKDDESCKYAGTTVSERKQYGISEIKMCNIFIIDSLQSLKQFFIKVPYHILVASLTLMALLKQSHQSKTGYKYMIWHFDEKLF